MSVKTIGRDKATEGFHQETSSNNKVKVTQGAHNRYVVVALPKPTIILVESWNIVDLVHCEILREHMETSQVAMLHQKFTVQPGCFEMF